MKKKLATAIAELQGSPNPKSIISFKYQDTKGQKKIKANVFYAPSGNLEYSIQNIQGYNKAYISAQLKKSFTELFDDQHSLPGAESVIYTKEYLFDNLTSGDTRALSGSKYYYAIGSQPIKCDGRQLGRDFTGTFIKYENKTCSSIGGIMAYSIFKLN